MFCVHVCLLYVWYVCELFVPSVLWYCWLGLLTCKNRLPYNLYCVGGDVKPCSINQSNNTQTKQLFNKTTNICTIKNEWNLMPGLWAFYCHLARQGLGPAHMYLFFTKSNILSIDDRSISAPTPSSLFISQNHTSMKSSSYQEKNRNFMESQLFSICMKNRQN